VVAGGGLLAERRRAARRRVITGGEAGGEVGGARIVVGEDGGEGEVRRERRRRAGALRVVQYQVEARAVPVREICKKKMKKKIVDAYKVRCVKIILILPKCRSKNYNP